MLGLRKSRDLVSGNLERDKLASAGKRDRIIKRRRHRLSGMRFSPLPIRPHIGAAAVQESVELRRRYRVVRGFRILSSRSLMVVGDWTGKTCLLCSIIAGWRAIYGRLNFLTAPIAGCRMPRSRSSIHTNIPAASAVRFAGARSTRGLAIMISLIGKSIRRKRPYLARDGGNWPFQSLPACHGAAGRFFAPIQCRSDALCGLLFCFL